MDRLVRTSAKALVIKDGCMLAIKLHDSDGEFYIMPGGGQAAGELLPATVQREVAEETGVEFVDMHNLSADFLDKKFAVSNLPADKEKAKAKIEKIKNKAGLYFKKDHTHASKLGAQMNAQSMAKGLRQNKSELAKYLKK